MSASVSHDAPARVVHIAARAMLFALVVSAFATPARAFAWSVDTSARTEAEVRAQWETMRPVYTGGPYVVVPAVTAPYAPGETTSAFRDDGLKAVNFGRYLAGLPADVTLTSDRNLDGQYGAVLLCTSPTLTHYPLQPSDMSDAFYDRGAAVARTSNIGSGFADLETFEWACLDDADASNIAMLGHRRWLLSPGMLYTGIGFAGSGYDTRATTYAFDQSRVPGSVDYDFIAWPSPGVFPVERANAMYVPGTTPWSITLNPARYDWTDKNGNGLVYTVVLQRVTDGRTWTFDMGDTDPAGEFFKAEFTNYGYTGNAFIFRPDPDDLAAFVAGEQFDVRLTGDIYAEGTATPVEVGFRTSFGTLSGAATVFSAPTDPSAVAGPVVSVATYAGADRYETAALAARAAYPDGAPTVVLACGRSFADALAASPLAGALDAPILLTDTSGLSSATAAAMTDLGTSAVYIVGGTGVVSDAVAGQLAALGVTSVERVCGDDRYATAREVALAAVALGADASSVFLVRGDDFADALAVSSIAAQRRMPVLLTTPDDLEPRTEAFLTSAGTSSVYVAGGTGAVSESVASQADPLTGVTVTRWSGGDRYATAAAVVGGAIARWGLSAARLGVASGADYPDALAGGAVLGHRAGLLLLTRPDLLPDATAQLVVANKATVESVEYFGGSAALAPAVSMRVMQLLQ